MATAAPPAAPTGAAPVAATPATPAGEPNAPQAAASPQPKQIKPIPPPPRLPGVMEDGPEDASAPDAVAARARDAQGRFVAKAEGDVVARPEPKAVEAADGEPTIPDLPEAKPKFKFMGREFDSQEAAEHYVKSMEGRYKPVQQKATEYEGKLVKAAESARGWHAEAQRLAAEIAQLRQTGAQPAQPEPAGEQPTGIDWDLYAEIAKVANEAGEPWKAQKWLQEQQDAIIRAELARVREEALAPYQEQQAAAAEQAEMAQTADAIVASMVAHTNPDGSPAFPEFQDGEKARAIGDLWQSVGLEPKLALTPGGAVAAVALYRLAQSMNTAPVPAPPAPPAPDPAALAAAGLEGGRPLVPAANPRRELDPGVARLVAGLKNTQLIRPGLGFEA